MKTTTCVGLLSASLLLFGCGKEEEIIKATVIRPIKMVALQAGGLKKTFEFSGVVQPSLQANLAFEVSGKIIDLLVKEGDEVEVGAIVATLDPRDYKSSLDASKARLEETQLEAARNQRLFEKNATSKEELEQSIRAQKTAQANFEQATKAYQDTFLRAPFAGTIARVLVDDFQTIRAKQEVILLQDTTSLEAVVDVPETLWSQVAVRKTNEERTEISRPMVRLTSLPGSSFPARISETGMQADPKTRTFPVTFAFTSPSDINISPGMTATVLLTAPSNLERDIPGFVVPVESVAHDDQGEAYVWRIDSSAMTAVRVPVEAGEMESNSIEITGALNNGDLIASSGVQQLREGMVVKKWQ
jgi:RND family efflux transporter MFP subunit